MGTTAKKFEKEFDGDLSYLVLLKVSCVVWVRHFWGVLSAAWLMGCIWGRGFTHKGLVTKAQHPQGQERGDKLQDSWKT